MQLKAFEAALRLIQPGPGDQPLMRILRIAMDLADCPAGLIGVRWPDRFEIIVSAGIPLSSFRQDLPRSEEIAHRFRTPCIIEDARAEPDFSGHVHVAGPMGWRFIANVPLPLTLLPFDVVLNCADPRTGVERRDNLLQRLEECAAIAADELRLISDIAMQSEQLATVDLTSELRREGVREAGMPMALIADGGRIDIINPRLAALLELPETPSSGSSLALADLFPMSALDVTARLEQVLSAGTPATAIVAHSRDMRKTYLIDLIRVVSADAEVPLALCTVTDRTRTFERAEDLQHPPGESPNVVAHFLLDTLVSQKRLLRRGPVPYHALRRWRAAVKDIQIAALKALKREPSAFFVEAAAAELAAAATALYGEGTMHAVAAVPCGNSGPNCLAERLAAAVAARLALPHVVPFAPLPPSGGSHPKGNTRRASMELVQPVDQPVLLIDDVATSGAHLAEAAMALKQSGTPAILPLVWIADS